MITVRVPSGDPSQAEAVTSVLDELVLAYRVEHGAPELALVDGGERVEASELPAYLDELRSLVALWRKYQSDACYVEDDGSIC